MTVHAKTIAGKLHWLTVERESGSGSGYHIGVTCRSCGGRVEPVVQGKVIHNERGAGTETRAIMACTECKPRREYVLEVFLGHVGAAERLREPDAKPVKSDWLVDRRKAHLAAVRELEDA